MFTRFCFGIDFRKFSTHLGSILIWQILLKLRVFRKLAISPPFIDPDRFSKFLCLKISSFNNEKLLLIRFFILSKFYLINFLFENHDFFPLLPHKQKNQIQLLRNSAWQTFSNCQFLMPHGYQSQKNKGLVRLTFQTFQKKSPIVVRFDWRLCFRKIAKIS